MDHNQRIVKARRIFNAAKSSVVKRHMSTGVLPPKGEDLTWQALEHIRLTAPHDYELVTKTEIITA